ARVAILCDGFLIGCGVTVVVAAEAAGFVGMAEIIGVSPPSDLEVGKDVAAINGEKSLTGGLDIGGALACDGRIFSPIVGGETGGDFLRGFVVARGVRLQEIDGGLLRVRQSNRD